MTHKANTDRMPTDARKSAIVAAALCLAETNSPAAITTTALAHAVGLSQGALFKHFPTKEAVWLAAMEWVVLNLMQALNSAAQEAASPGAALRNVFDAHVDFVAAHPGVPRLIFHQLQQPGESAVKQQARGLMQGYRVLLQQLLKAAVDNGEAAADLDLGAAATMYLGLMQGLVMQSVMSGQNQAIRAQAPKVFELYLRGIRAQT